VSTQTRATVPSRIENRNAFTRVQCLCILALATLLSLMLPTSGAAQMTRARRVARRLPPLAGDSVSVAFGPKVYTREAGPPNTFTDSFSHCGSGQQCQIVVMNGNADGDDRISSASISLNGVQIIGPSDFNQNVDRIVKPVVLKDNNELTIRLASKPGSFLTVEVECASGGVILSAGDPGASVLGGTLLTALPINNDGTAAAESVTATAITLTGGTLVTPPVPFSIGTIGPGDTTVLNATFSGAFTPLTDEMLSVNGTYSVGGATFCFELSGDFTIPPAASGTKSLGHVTVPSNSASGGGFPHQPLNFPDDSNETSRWTIPIAPLVPGTPSVGTAAIPSPIGDPPAITFLANNREGLTSGGSNGTASTVAEPSGAGPIAGKTTGKNVVFTTANWVAAYSTDGGSTFKQLDPTTIFPKDAVGYCCDQIVQYVPSIDRFIWLLQGKGYRIAMASPDDIVNSGGTAWTYWNLTPDIFSGFPNESLDTSFDYPDLSVGNNFLYLNWDAGVSCASPCDWGHQVARISLAQLQAAGTITIEYTDPGDGRSAWGAKLSQDTGNGVFWAGQDDNSHMRVFSMYEGDGFYSWRVTGISSWATSGISSTTPDGSDWLTKLRDFPGGAVIGGTRTGNTVWFAWSAGTDGNFHQPHVEMVALDSSNNFSKSQQVQIWNNSYAFAYPALATNVCTGEVGLSLEFGGNGNYENHVVGFWGDFVVYITTNTNLGTTRFGDYVSIRQAPSTTDNPGNLFSAFGYGLDTPTPPTTGTQTDLRYVLFGRPASSCIIIK
jgi:hypothetical protein